MIEKILSDFVSPGRSSPISPETTFEAKKRVLDSLGCFYGAFESKPTLLLRSTLTSTVMGECYLWGTDRSVPAETAAWVNGASVRALDYNDTYLSKEPCHPSDLMSSLWAACELSSSGHEGRSLIEGMVVGYDVLCRLCDAASIRLKGWDHVTYLPIASAIGCSTILGLNETQVRHAIALAIVGNNALRQTRVGEISDWKAACAAYAARAGLWASRLAKAGFTGPSDIFSGRHGFFKQISGPFSLSTKSIGKPWKMMSTHVKYFPAEHHAQSAIEAAIELRSVIAGNGNPSQEFKNISIECFDVAVDIIGSEPEKWKPKTRETADHSMPYLVVAALLDGDINLQQYEKKRFLDADIAHLLSKVRVKNSKRYSKMYPKFLPTKVSITLKNGKVLSKEVLRPLGYAGRPMSEADIRKKFDRLASVHISEPRRGQLSEKIFSLEEVEHLAELRPLMKVNQ